MGAVKSMTRPGTRPRPNISARPNRHGNEQQVPVPAAAETSRAPDVLVAPPTRIHRRKSASRSGSACETAARRLNVGRSSRRGHAISRCKRVSRARRGPKGLFTDRLPASREPAQDRIATYPRPFCRSVLDLAIPSVPVSLRTLDTTPNLACRTTFWRFPSVSGTDAIGRTMPCRVGSRRHAFSSDSGGNLVLP